MRLMHTRLTQMLAASRALDGDFAAFGAAEGTNLAIDTGALALGAPLVADLTCDVHGVSPIIIEECRELTCT
jgi:hypothetical protein